MKGTEAAAVALGTTAHDKAEVSPPAEVVVAATRRIDEGIMASLARTHADSERKERGQLFAASLGRDLR